MPGTLYLVPTPIGNLSDVSDRCRETLALADFIAAEDTRVSLRLLNALEMKKELVSYHEHNKAASGPRILERLLAGQSCALVTDAGCPAISDPGEDLVRLCTGAGVPVCAIPGPCAAITALSVSALPTGRFVFEGFLPMQKKERRERLERLKIEERTLIFYEAPHHLRGTLDELLAAFGPDRPLSLCRELTKLHEEVLRLTLGQAVDYYKANEPRGEYVLVLGGAAPKAETVILEQAAELVRALIDGGMRTKDAVKQIAEETGVPKNALYAAVI